MNHTEPLLGLQLKHLADGLVCNAARSIGLARAQYRHDLRGLERVIAANFAALTVNLTLVITAMKTNGFAGDDKRYENVLNLLNCGASTTEQMAVNIAAAVSEIEGEAAAVAPIAPTYTIYQPGW